MKPINPIVLATPPSGIRRFFDVAAQMDDVVSLGVGEPDFVTPWRIREAAIYSLEKGHTSYTSNAGLPALREAIGDYVERLHGVHYSPSDEIIVTVGVSEGLDLALRTILTPGDEVIVFEPCYVSYVPCVRFAGGQPVSVRTDGSNGFRVPIDAIADAITPRTKAILLCFPNNPTGATLSGEDVAAIADLAQRHDLYIVSDEIYDRLTYTGRHCSAAAAPGARDRTILLNGFSKAYAMTGWRIAYICAPRELSEQILKMHQYTMLCASQMAQQAALEALRYAEADVLDMVAEYDRRRRLFVRGLNDIGMDCHEPTGAFYAFPSIRRSGLDSETFAERMLFEERVAVVPGTAFGECGEGHVRCSYATSAEQLELALERMGRFMERARAGRVASRSEEQGGVGAATG